MWPGNRPSPNGHKAAPIVPVAFDAQDGLAYGDLAEGDEAGLRTHCLGSRRDSHRKRYPDDFDLISFRKSAVRC
jgi:hypothetical protein